MNDESRKLKVAFIIDRFLPSRGGENYFSLLARELSRRGHEVHVFTMEADKTPVSEYQIHSIPVLRYPRCLRILSFLIQSRRIVRHNDFDIIHGVGLSLAMNVFNPHAGVEHVYLKQEFRSITNRCYYFYKLLKRYLSPQHYLIAWIQKRQYLSQKVKKIIAISTMVKRNIIQYYQIPEEKIEVIFNCVDLDRFHPRNRELYRGKKRTAINMDQDTLLLIFAGNNYRLKGLDPLLQALVLLRRWAPDKPFRLLIAGRGQRGRYLRKAKKMGVSDLTIFLGAVKEIEQYYAASDIYVHPTFYDSCSLTVLEALASGLPVITSRFNGAADVILSDKGGKILDDPAEVEDLARSIFYFFDEERRNEARVITRKWMEKYSPNSNVEGTLRVYYQVVKEVRKEIFRHQNTVAYRSNENGN